MKQVRTYIGNTMNKSCELFGLFFSFSYTVAFDNFIKIELFYFFSSGLIYVRGVHKHNGRSVKSTIAADGLRIFILWRFPNTILIGHNIKSFKIRGRPNLLNGFEGSAEDWFDTLKLVRKVILKAEVGNYKQENLVQEL